jgi:hypothetical protein
MYRRIGIWALCGFTVAFVLFLLILAAPRGQGPSLESPFVYILAAPLALLRHHPITYYQSFVINAAGYALLGLAIELVAKAFRGFFPTHRA